MIKTCRLAFFAAVLAPIGVVAANDIVLPAPAPVAVVAAETDATEVSAEEITEPKPVEVATIPQDGWYAVQLRGSISAAGMVLSKCCELLPAPHPADLPTEIAAAESIVEGPTEVGDVEEVTEIPAEETIAAAPVDEPRPLADAVDGYALPAEANVATEESIEITEDAVEEEAVEEEAAELVLVPNEPELLAAEELLTPPEPILVDESDEVVAEAPAADAPDLESATDELSTVTDAWPNLSEETRRAILDMIDGELAD